ELLVSAGAGSGSATAAGGVFFEHAAKKLVANKRQRVLVAFCMGVPLHESAAGATGEDFYALRNEQGPFETSRVECSFPAGVCSPTSIGRADASRKQPRAALRPLVRLDFP